LIVGFVLGGVGNEKIYNFTNKFLAIPPAQSDFLSKKLNAAGD
jgi:hypothetical protein